MFLFEDKSLSINGYFKAYYTTEKTWHHLNFFQYECYLHARIPRIDAGIYDTKTVDDFEKLLKKCYFWATHSKLGPIIQAAKTIKRHGHGISNWILKKLNNGILGGFNSLFQAAKAKARGYRRFDTISIIIYLLTGKLDFPSINHYCNTHSK